MRYYKGGGSSAPTETTVTNTDLPDYVEPYFKRLLQRGEAESLQGYDPYGGQRLAYFSPDELTSQAMTRGFATSGTPQAFTRNYRWRIRSRTSSVRLSATTNG